MTKIYTLLLRNITAAVVLAAAALPSDAESIDTNAYYRITNNSYTEKCVTVTSSGLTNSTVSDDNIANQAFKFIATDTDNEYYLYNPGTRTYVATCSQSQKVQLTYLQAAAQTYAVTTITPETGDAYTTIGNANTNVGDYRYFHADAQQNVVGWETAADASKWTISLINNTKEVTVSVNTADGTLLNSTTETLPVGGGYGDTYFATNSGSITIDDTNATLSYTLKTGEGIRLANANAIYNGVYDFIEVNSSYSELCHAKGSDQATNELSLFSRINIDSDNYMLYNASCQKFAKPITGSEAVKLTSKVEEAGIFTFQFNSDYAAYKFRNYNAADNSAEYANAFGGYNYGTTVGGWTAGDDLGSHWLMALSGSETAFVDNIAKYQSFRTALSNIKTVTNATNAATTSTWVNTTADCMNSNYPAVDTDGTTVYDGGGYAALIDDNTETYFHTAWTSKGDISNGYTTTNHDLQIRMSDNTKSNFYVQYTPRSGNAATPTAMNIYGATGSTDTWNEIEWESTPFATVSGLSTSGGTFYINAKGKVYTALKFEMTTVNGSTGKYYNYSGFKLYATENSAFICQSINDAISTASSTKFGEISTSDLTSRINALTQAEALLSIMTDNTTLCTLQNCDTYNNRGYAVYNGSSEYLQRATSLEDSDNNLWGIVTDSDGKYYLYNYGAKKFANAYGEGNSTNSQYHTYSWRLSDVGTPVEFTYNGYSFPAVSIIGGENNASNARGAGMSTFNNCNNPIVVCDGATSNADGNGWLFSKVSTTATEDEINALLANKSATETTVNEQFSALPEASDDNAKVVGNYTNSALEAIAKLSDDANADAKHHAMESAERVNLTPDAVYTIKGSDSDKYYCVNNSDVQDFLSKDELTNANLFNWIAVSNENGTISFVHKVNDGESSSASAPAMRRAVKSTITLTIDDQKEFTPTFPEVGVTALNGTNTVITFESNDQTVADTVTAISEITVDGNNANAAIYDLQGRRVNTVARGGIYIVGGQKVRL